MSSVLGPEMACNRRASKGVLFSNAIHKENPVTQEAFLLAPISPEAAATLRAKGGPMYVADEYPSYPCRQACVMPLSARS